MQNNGAKNCLFKCSAIEIPKRKITQISSKMLVWYCQEFNFSFGECLWSGPLETHLESWAKESWAAVCKEAIPGNCQGHGEQPGKGSPASGVKQSLAEANLGLVSLVSSGKGTGHTLDLSPSWGTELECCIPRYVGHWMCQAPLKHFKLVMFITFNALTICKAFGAVP